MLTQGEPPKIVYVGITEQHPHARLSDHRNNKAPGSFDNMRVIATGLSSRRKARNIEGSALFRISKGQIPGIPRGSLLNKKRVNNGGYWHAYRDNGDPVRRPMSTSATRTALEQNVITLPR
ncbi:hypothetical protein [Myxococcus stipitatus]|uniref:hypothetical protein n=1 Tax=Myxococcus stipitatus TaxID=83455 RepID=UPI0030CD4043